MIMPESTFKYKPLAVSLTVSAAMLMSGLILTDKVTVPQLTGRLLMPLLTLMGFIAAGLVAGQVIEASGWTRTLGVAARPFFRFGHLGDRCGAAFTAAFVSGVTANAMLLDFYKEGKITRQQLFVTNFVNQLPAYFLHLPTTFFIVLPLTGKAGVIYYFLTFLATFIRTFLCLVYGRFFIHPETGMATNGKTAAVPGDRQSWKKMLQAIKEKIPKRLVTVFVYVLPVYIAVFMINALNFFNAANQLIARNLSLAFIPVEALSVVVLSFAAEFTSGFAAAGAFLDAGLINVEQTVLALLAGNIIAFPLRAIRHQLPRYMGIYSPKMGLQILLLGQFFRVLSLIAVGICFFMLY
jgi:hypothetical protein